MHRHRNGDAGPILTAARVHARVVDTLERFTSASTGFVESFLQVVLTNSERSALGIALYDQRADGPRQTGLVAWEREWFDTALPQAPSRILVGAVGAGREAVDLVLRGHQVDAFEPSERSVHGARARLGGTAEVLVGRYEELTASVLDGLPGPLSDLTQRRYDAVLLGWGSFSHVLYPAERLRLLKACRILCPVGPILASFWFDDGTRATPMTRSRAMGRRVGGVVGALRGGRSEACEDAYVPRLGFCHAFGPEELAHLAAEAGLTVEIAAGPYPHATFRPTLPGP